MNDEEREPTKEELEAEDVDYEDDLSIEADEDVL